MVHIRAVLLDIDGTLVNSNDAHAHAWIDAMREHGHTVPFEKVRPLIGMGGDKVLPDVLGIEKDSEEGKQISERRKEIFKERYLSTVQAFPKAQELLQRMHDSGLKLVVATSSTPQEMKSLLDIVGPHAMDLLTQEASDKDASKSKPDDDVIMVALRKANVAAQEVLMLGDTPYNIEAAGKAQVATIAVRCGGWKDKELAQAVAVYNDPADLLTNFDTSPLMRDVERPTTVHTHIDA